MPFLNPQNNGEGVKDQNRRYKSFSTSKSTGSS